MSGDASPGVSGPIPLSLLGDRHAADAAVRLRAEELVRRTRERLPAWNPPPFDPRMFAEVLGIRVRFHPLPQWDALLIPTHAGYEILCDSGVRSEGRRRFSIAHELAHTFFADADETYRMRTASRSFHPASPESELERLCDRGAAELLMPAGCFGSAIREFGLRASAVKALADRFAVSLEAAARRLVEIAEEPCAVGFFEYAVRPSEQDAPEPAPYQEGEPPRYRVRQAHGSARFPFLFPQGKSVARDSVIYRAACGSEDATAREAFSLGRDARMLEVSACRLGAATDPVEPPQVCAVFRMA